MISNLAVVHPDAKLGEGVEVAPFAIIEGDVVIGDGTYIGSSAVIKDGAIIGKNCIIETGAIIAGVPQDLKFNGEKTTAEIGDRTTIREYATINRGTAAKGRTIVGSDCLVMAYVHVGHDCIVGDKVILVNRVSLAGEVEIGDWAIVAGHSGIHQFTRIGAHSMIGGLLKLVRDAPPYIKAAHEQVSYIGVNSIGLRRRGFTAEAISEIQDIYRIIFQSNLATRTAVERVEAEFAPSEHRDAILDFIKSSSRGIIKQYQSKLKDNDVMV
ncbi:MAG: acyl-ACP--UDP-N-acetylglucosamine O-acyltransferase [Rikenellaceae bacterium]